MLAEANMVVDICESGRLTDHFNHFSNFIRPVIDMFLQLSVGHTEFETRTVMWNLSPRKT